MPLLNRIQPPSSDGARQGTPPDRGSRPTTHRPAEVRGGHDQYRELRRHLQSRIIQDLDPNVQVGQDERLRQEIRRLFERYLAEEPVALPRDVRERLFEEVVAEIVGFGPLEPLLADESITEILVNGPNNVYIERGGKLIKTSIRFDDDDHVRRIIDRIISPIGRRCDESSPMVDARLPDGSRFNAVIPPISLVGPCMSIRKFPKLRLTMDDLIRFGTLTPQVAEFLRACVLARLNIIVAGGTGSGKTTLLNILSSYIPEDERIITIEDAAELKLHQEHVVTLETRKPNIEGKGAITIRDLVINALRMRPDRIVVGECRGAEALDMLQAMNTGHDGSLTTLHANSPRDALSRLETMVMMAGMELPHKAIRDQIASAIDLIIFVERMRDGSRKVTYVTEVQGMEGDTIILQDIFLFEQLGIDENGRVVGRLKPLGIRPKFIERIENAGIHLPPEIFGVDRFRPW